MSIMTLMHGIRTAVVAASAAPVFASSVLRTPGGTIGNRTGWTLGTLTPNSYDDGYAGTYSIGGTWYMNNVGYTTFYISSNGMVTLNGGNGGIFSTPQSGTNSVGFWITPGDNYWASNAGNGSNAPDGVAYKTGTSSSSSYNYFRINMQAYAYGNSGIGRSWEMNVIWNPTTNAIYVEFVYPSTILSAATAIGLYTGATVYQNAITPGANTSYCYSSTDGGVTWTVHGYGSFSNITFP